MGQRICEVMGIVSLGHKTGRKAMRRARLIPTLLCCSPTGLLPWKDSKPLPTSRADSFPTAGLRAQRQRRQGVRKSRFRQVEAISVILVVLLGIVSFAGRKYLLRVSMS